jgi:hypothetical protein
MKILVLYYSQTGQLRTILNSITSTIVDCNIDFAPIELLEPYPFPWKTFDAFFDAMPESVLSIGKEIKPILELTNTDYDLIILGFQPWFLSPSVPITSFFKSKYASYLKDKPIITVIGCRNMWLRALQHVKQYFNEIGAQHVGNIVLVDNNKNLTSTTTIAKWLVTGDKGPYKRYPEAGIIKKDIDEAKRFGPLISEWIKNGMQANALQATLLKTKAVTIKPELVILEQNGAKQFPKWAKKAISYGQPGSEKRRKFLIKFKIALFVSIYILSPISGTIAKMQAFIKRAKTRKDIDYYKSVHYIPNKI